MQTDDHILQFMGMRYHVYT